MLNMALDDIIVLLILVAASAGLLQQVHTLYKLSFSLQVMKTNFDSVAEN